LSVFGVYLVYTTFRTATESNEIAIAVLLAETRPVLAFDRIYVGRSKYAFDEFSFVFKNIGKGPAIIKSIIVTEFLIPWKHAKSATENKRTIPFGLDGKVVPVGETITHDTPSLSKLGTYMYKVECTVHYGLGPVTEKFRQLSFKTTSTADFYPRLAPSESHGGLMMENDVPVVGDFSKNTIVGAVAMNIVVAKQMT
jgi:hypothetical protein